MNRRKFLISLLLSFIAVVLIPFFYFKHEFLKYLLADYIQSQLSFLKISKEDVDAFVVDYINDKNNLDTESYLKLVVLMLFFKNPTEHGRVLEVLDGFIRSTDFLTNDMNVDKEIKYVKYNIYSADHRYLHPCLNPFSETFYPTGKLS